MSCATTQVSGGSGDAVDLRLAGNSRRNAVAVLKPGSVEAEATRAVGKFLRDEMKLNLDKHNFRLFGPDETALSLSRLARHLGNAG